MTNFRVFGGFLLILLAGMTMGCRSVAPVATRSVEAPSTGVKGTGVKSAGVKDAESVEITLLQLNDVYEIGAVEGGKRGGLARVATLRKKLLKQNPHTFVVHAGDMLSPSAMGTAKVEGERLAGRQMVAVLNLLGLDFATFGNHEFDLKEQAFLDRLEESDFQWISANVTDRNGKAFPGSLSHVVVPVPVPGGEEVRLGIIGVTLEFLGADYLQISDPLAAVRAEAKALRSQVDVLVGLTHLTLDQDAALAESVPELDLILGGHEHENFHLRRGSKLTPILKADANARSVFIHKITIDRTDGTVEILPRFLPITDAIPEDPAVAKEVARWTQSAFDGFRKGGFQPEEVVATSTTPLDGREASVRNRSTALTDLIAAAFLTEAKGADLGVYNSGSIRIDDVIPTGPVSQYDVIRILPFGGEVLSVKLRGSVLEKALNAGLDNQGTGGFLHTANLTGARNGWKIGGEDLDENRDYLVGISDFLMTGREAGLEFLKLGSPGIELVATNRDVRMALIDQLKATYVEK